jgi:hypothetical protein
MIAAGGLSEPLGPEHYPEIGEAEEQALEVYHDMGRTLDLSALDLLVPLHGITDPEHLVDLLKVIRDTAAEAARK